MILSQINAAARTLREAHPSLSWQDALSWAGQCWRESQEMSKRERRAFFEARREDGERKQRHFFSDEEEALLLSQQTIYQLFKTLGERARSGDYRAWQTLRSYQHSSIESLDAIPKEVTKEFERKRKLDHQSFDRLVGWLQYAIHVIKDKRRSNQDHVSHVSARESLSFAKMHLEDEWYHTAEDRELFQVHLEARWEDGSTLLPDLQQDTAKDWATVAVDFWEAECFGDWERSPLWKLLGKDVLRRAALESRRSNSEFRSRLTDKFRRFLQDDPKRFG